MALNTPLCKHTHILLMGVSVGPLTEATLPKARNILYASMQVLIAMQVKILLALLLSKMSNYNSQCNVSDTKVSLL